MRWAESVNRKNKRSSLEVLPLKKKNKVILNADNDEHRRIFETCITQGKRILNPIVDWTDDDVWELLKIHGCKTNPLYERGFKRIGCLGCPMAKSKGMKMHFEHYPEYKAAYIRTFAKMLEKRDEDGLSSSGWNSPEDVYNWWISTPEKQYAHESQLTI